MAKEHICEKVVLPNGLTVLLYPMTGVMSAFAIMYIRVGAIYEPRGLRGISHFNEHVSLLGTKKFPSRIALGEETQKIGASNHAWTSQSATAFWVKLPSVNFEQGLNLLSQTIFAPTLDEDELTREKDVVLAEFNDFWHNPERRFWHEIWRKRFSEEEHPYSYRPLGTPETITKLNRQIAVAWREKYFRPNNMVLSVAGDFNSKYLLGDIQKMFGDTKPGPESSEPKFATNKYSAALTYHLEDPRPQATYCFSFPLFGFREVDRRKRMALGLLGYIFGNGPFSRLFRRIREKEGLVYSTGSDVQLKPWMGGLEIYGSTDVEKLVKAASATQEEIEKLVATGVTDKEVALAKTFINSQTLMQFDNPQSVAYFMGDQEVDKEEIWSPEKYIEKGNKITKEEVNALAEEIFDYEKLNIGLLGNVPENTIKEVEKVFKS